MNNKILISIIVIALVILGFFILSKTPESKCGDGICGARELKNPDLCPGDCEDNAVRPPENTCPRFMPPSPRLKKECEESGGKLKAKKNNNGCYFGYECEKEIEKTCSEQGGDVCSSDEICSGALLDASDSDSCCSVACGEELNLEPTSYDNIVPFGIHPGTPVEYVNDIGIKWIRGGSSPYLFWSLVDSDMSGDNFQWSGQAPNRGKATYNYDALSFAEENKLSMLKNIAVEPPGITGYANSKSWLPKDTDAYSNFVRATVKRYPFIKYWQIGNEPVAKLDDYGEFICLTYEAIKEADPNVKVLLGGVAGLNRDPNDFSVYQNNFDRAFFPLLEDLSSQNKRCFDIFDFHYFGYAGDDYLMVKDVYNHISGKINGLNMPAPEEYWITEDGTYSGDPKLKAGAGKERKDPPYQSEEEQAISLIKRFIYPTTFGIKKVFWAWGIKEGFHHDDSYFDFTGLVYDGEYDYDLGNGVKKLSYYSYKKMVEVLDGVDWNNIEVVRESNGIYVYKFNNQDKDIWVAWNDNSASKIIFLNVGSISSVEITEAVPKYETGKEVSSYSTAFNTETKTASSGNVSITLGDSPVFVEGN